MKYTSEEGKAFLGVDAVGSETDTDTQKNFGGFALSRKIRRYQSAGLE